MAGFKLSGEIARTMVGPNVRVRILTDLSGPFDTVVQEIEVESLAEWERLREVSSRTLRSKRRKPACPASSNLGELSSTRSKQHGP